MSTYWLVSVPSYRGPGEKRKEEKINSEEWKRLEKNTRDRQDQKTTSISMNYAFKIPALKVGTLDKLMSVSDKLAKADVVVEQIVKKIERAFFEFWKTQQEDGESKAEAKQEMKGEQEVPELKIERKSLDKNKPDSEWLSSREYIEKFQWDVSRYNPKRDLNELVDNILEAAHKSDEKLKKQTAEYTEVKQGLLAIERRETGTLLVKPLGAFVSGENAKYIIEKEFLTTLLVVVPKAKEKNFLDEYEVLEELAADREEKENERKREEAEKKAKQKEEEDKRREKEKEKDDERKKPVDEAKLAKLKAEKEEDRKREQLSKQEVEAQSEAKRRAEGKKTCQNVVPRSAVRLTPADYEGEFSLYRIVVFKKGEETIKNLCREKRYTVRPFAYDPKEEQEQVAEKKRLLKDRKKIWSFLIRFAKTQYSDIFSAWIHLKAMRVFSESVLRFGLPIDFHATLMEPRKGKEPRLRQVLKDLYKDLPNAALAEVVEGEQDLSGVGTEFYPYVYFVVNPTAS